MAMSRAATRCQSDRGQEQVQHKTTASTLRIDVREPTNATRELARHQLAACCRKQAHTSLRPQSCRNGPGSDSSLVICCSSKPRESSTALNWLALATEKKARERRRRNATANIGSRQECKHTSDCHCLTGSLSSSRMKRVCRSTFVITLLRGLEKAR
jgi:hypothetical protein